MMRLVPKLAALSAAFLLALAGGAVAYAAPVTSSAVNAPADNTTSSGSQASVPSDDNPASTPTDSAVSPGDSVSTPSGTGTVIASSTNGGKQFYTIQTPAGNTFYLIIDLNQQTNNVYFLDNVTEQDLMALAVKSVSGAATGTASVNPIPSAASTVSQPVVSSPAPAATSTKSSGPNFSMILLVLIILGGGGVLFYIKVYRPKHQNDSRDEYEEDDEAEKPDTRDEDDYSDDDDYEAEQEEDTESADDET